MARGDPVDSLAAGLLNMPPPSSDPTGKAHRFGGGWTDKKLAVLTRYLEAYTKALKDQPFRKEYIDAFAGTGYRDDHRESTAAGAKGALLFPELAAVEPQALLDGSARLALRANPPFDAYTFIERNPVRCAALAELKSEFPRLSRRIEIRQGDANDQLRTICARDWRSRRAVLFLDPYGMQVRWSTIQAVARTEAIDMWLLFPLGMGVDRVLPRSGDVPDSWRRALNELLGTENWHEEFYRPDRSPTLFADDSERLTKASRETIGRYFNDRLASIFAGVAHRPGVLRNSMNSPLYLFCFAAGNKRGAPIAQRIAEHLLEELR